MAREKPDTVPAPTLTEQIEAAITTLQERRAEVKRLDEESSELAGSDVEASILRDVRARSIEKWCGRERVRVEDLIKKRHAEQLTAYLKRIDQLYESLSGQAKAAAEKLREAAKEAYAALVRMREISGGGVSGAEVLKNVPTTNFERQIAEDLGGAITGLARGIVALRQHAQNRDYFPGGGPGGGNMYDSMMFSNLRQAMGGDLELDRFPDLEEEPEPVAVVAGMH